MTREEKLEARAVELGKKYGEGNRLADVEARCKALVEASRGLNHPPGACEAMCREAMEMGCSPSWFDVFKYAAQDVWRARGEMKPLDPRCPECGDPSDTLLVGNRWEVLLCEPCADARPEDDGWGEAGGLKWDGWDE